ncbi:hypothetical protein MUO66_08335 [Candidatus Bathyarchaeota archaeon]|nr:hypothetical protein [Candidatus Bathyarchaeota archaeon]
MNLKSLLNNNWLDRVIITAWISSAILVIFMLTNLDVIVNGTLYGFGLQFSNEWGEPYWMYLRLSYAFLGVSSCLGFLALMIGFYRSKSSAPETSTIAVNKSIKNNSKIDVIKPQKAEQTPKRKNESKEENNMIISCPNCKKVFGRPLVMLNFEGGKTKLVNVCPYCNNSLDQTDDSEKSDTEVHIRGQDSSAYDQRINRT